MSQEAESALQCRRCRNSTDLRRTPAPNTPDKRELLLRSPPEVHEGHRPEQDVGGVPDHCAVHNVPLHVGNVPASVGKISNLHSTTKMVAAAVAAHSRCSTRAARGPHLPAVTQEYWDRANGAEYAWPDQPPSVELDECKVEGYFCAEVVGDMAAEPPPSQTRFPELSLGP